MIDTDLKIKRCKTSIQDNPTQIEQFRKARKHARSIVLKDIPKGWKMIIRLHKVGYDDDIYLNWTISFIMDKFVTSGTKWGYLNVSLRWWNTSIPNLNIYDMKIKSKGIELDLDLFGSDLKQFKKLIKKMYPIIVLDPMESLILSCKNA